MNIDRVQKFRIGTRPPQTLPTGSLSRKTAQQRRLRAQALVGGLVALVGLLGVGLVYREPISQFALRHYHWRMVMGPRVLTAGEEKERVAKPGPDSAFAECKKGCPLMIMVPACKLPDCKFEMGSPEDELVRSTNGVPQHEVRIAKPFAVSKFEVTFAEWDACAEAGTCQRVADRWGRGQMPVINVSWDEATQYIGWLSWLTGKEYRLLTEAEWEYAARAGTPTR